MKKDLSTPIAIVLAGFIIAAALYFALSGKAAPSPRAVGEQMGGVKQGEALEKLSKVKSGEHIKGNPKAKVKLVEYSDFECPFCKRFHGTMNKVVEEYGDKVAWVYRQFPLVQLHPKNAYKAALASECAAKLGGNDAFWSFSDKYFELTASNDTADFDTLLKGGASAAGLSAEKIYSCMEESEIKNAVEEDIKNAVETGGRGTPWSIIISKSGKKIPVNGAVPYEQLKQIIDYALEN